MFFLISELLDLRWMKFFVPILFSPLPPGKQESGPKLVDFKRVLAESPPGLEEIV